MAGLTSAEIEKLSSFELFRGLDADLVKRLLSGAVTRQLKHREFFFRAGDLAQYFCIVDEGAMKLLRHSPRGEDVIMHFAVQGDVVGALLMNQNDSVTYPISAKSMGPTRIICISKSTFKQHWRLDVNIQSRLNSHLYRRMGNIQDDKTMSTSPLRVRIANLLIRHLDQESDSLNQPLSLRLTRQEIADTLGVAVESVIRAMRDWVDDGTIFRASEKSEEVINVEKILRHLEP